MKPYSNDLRSRIVAAYESGGHTLEEVAELFGVSLASVKNFVRRHRETGSADALPPGGGQQAVLTPKHMRFLCTLLQAQNDLTLEELRQRLQQRYRHAVSLSTLSRGLQRVGLPRKKSRSTPVSAIR